MTASIHNLRFDLGEAMDHHRIVITQGGSGPCEVKLSQSSLTKFALRRLPIFQSVQMSLEGNRITAGGQMQWQGKLVPFTATGSLSIVDGVKLEVEDARLVIDSKPLSADATKFFLATLNPLLDLNRDLHLDNGVTMTSVRYEAPFFVIDGTATVPKTSTVESFSVPHG